jgi:hypothetical protein
VVVELVHLHQELLVQAAQVAAVMAVEELHLLLAREQLTQVAAVVVMAAVQLLQAALAAAV